MSAWFGEAWDAQQEEEDPFLNAGDVPVPAGQPQTAPTPLNPNAGGFRDPVYNPANVTPGGVYAPNPDLGIFTPFHPINEAIQPYVGPAADMAGRLGSMAFETQNLIGALGTPGGQGYNPETSAQVGEFVGRGLVPQSVEEFGLNALGGGGVTGFDDVIRGAAGLRGLTDDVIRLGFPEPNVFGANYGAGIPPMNPMGGENVFGPGVHGATPDDAAILAAQREATLNNPYPWGPGDVANAPPPPPAPYPSIPEGTMGEMFPTATDIRDAVRGGTPPSQAQVDALIRAGVSPETASAPVRSVPIDPNSPAARMGAPLQADPSLMGPPAGVSDVVPPPQAVDDTAQQMRDAFANVRREEDALTGGAVSSPPPESPVPTLSGSTTAPPASLTPPNNLDDLIREATAPPQAAPFPMTTDEAMAAAERLNIPLSREALERGTPLTRQGEMDVLAAGMEFDNALRSTSTESRALEGFIDANRGAPPPPTSPTGGATGRTPPPGGGGNNPTSKAYDTLVDLLYAPFGFDQSQWFRQLDMRTLNPLRAQETAQTFKVSTDALRSADAARAHFDGLAGRLAAIDPNLKMNFADWKGDFLSRETMTSKTLNNLPGYEAMNRGFVTAINERRMLALEDFAKNHPKAKPAEVQSYANYLERVTGRGAFGGSDKAISRLGPLFTSLRFTASWPQRTASLLPYHRLADGSWQIGGSAWGEAVKDHAGFIATGLTTMLLAQQAGLNVGWNPDKSNFGSIRVGDQHVDIWGGGKQYVKAVLDVLNGTKNGQPYPAFLQRQDDGTYKGTIAEFLRNKGGPVVGAGAAALKDTGAAKQLGIENEVKFLRPDYWDKGVTGRAMGWADRVGQYVVPLWVQDVAKAVLAEGETNPLRAGAVAGAGSFVGASVQTYATNALSEMRNSVLAPTGQKYADLLPHEKESLNKALESVYGEKYLKASQENQARLDPAIREYQTQRDQTYAQANSRIDTIVKGLQEGQQDPRMARLAIQALDKEAGAKVGELRQGEAYQKAVGEFDNNKMPSPANQALTIYYNIPGMYKGADGKIDWDAANAKREELLNGMPPALRARLEQEVNAPSENDHPYVKMLKAEGEMVGRYKSLPDAEEARLRIANPFDDAKLVYMGYAPYVLTPQAATYLNALAPGYPAKVGRR